MGKLVQDGAATNELMSDDHLLEESLFLLVEECKSIHISIAAEKICGEIGELPKDTPYIQV